MRNLVVLLLFLISLSSCVVIGLTNDYGKLNTEQRQLIVPLANFDEAKTGKIHKLNAPQLKESISKQPKSIVYVFSVGCISHESVPISVFEDFAEQNEYKLYLVLTGYSYLERVLNQEINTPLYSIDDQYYKTRYRHIYERYFTNELMNLHKKAKYNEREYSGWIFFYNYEQLVNVFHEFPESNELIK